ncbi:MAG TPA: hypothetical protein VLF71_05135 [Candidatus Saccharimonadales bacterium]|nr:hypothetical protein [Candidatus Saccharimonadales bacterium]
MASSLLRALQNAGHEIIRDPYQADVVFAHSGGCFLVPPDLPARRVVMVGLTYWPGKSIVRALIQKNANDFHAHRGDRNLRAWAHKFTWNTVYFWNMAHNVRMLRARARGEFWHATHATHATVVRNKEDSFCAPNLASLPFTHPPHLVELAGQHDDCWLHPERYLAVIQ